MEYLFAEFSNYSSLNFQIKKKINFLAEQCIYIEAIMKIIIIF